MQRGAQLAVSVAATSPVVCNERAQLVIARAIAQRRTQVQAGAREQTGVEDAFRGKSRARAAAAERVGDRRDEADLARAVVECVTLGHFAVIVLFHGVQRPVRTDAL